MCDEEFDDDEWDLVVAPVDTKSVPECVSLSRALSASADEGWAYKENLDWEAFCAGWTDGVRAWQREACARWSILCSKLDADQDRQALRRQLVLMMRRGCANSCRKEAWLSLSGYAQERKAGLMSGALIALNDMQADGKTRLAARKIKHPPTFGGELRLQEHHLSPQGADSTRRILAALALAHPHLLGFSPQITDLVPTLLAYMSEEEACGCVDALLGR
eukprot:CAMPEP_0206224006 /NCGR_PEP_ID=MMETSP0047_2-20121206/6793_1 /ASSEMBLY_ACC=CAM_ASM_000192 /TAXON_ID=195065 /ORGANISM="Chroomonas mesostigmatica_cf, Strain CCMP1168" /LENGTH=218 /DNA_ID=CAMNT_0053646929 /DNA_START=345 /DNA_END=997 /DNA_ORIENTATION=-